MAQSAMWQMLNFKKKKKKKVLKGKMLDPKADMCQWHDQICKYYLNTNIMFWTACSPFSKRLVYFDTIKI